MVRNEREEEKKSNGVLTLLFNSQRYRNISHTFKYESLADHVPAQLVLSRDGGQADGRVSVTGIQSLCAEEITVKRFSIPALENSRMEVWPPIPRRRKGAPGKC